MLLTSSLVYKELDKLANQNVPGDNRTLLSDRHWKRICNDINTLFPKLRPFVFGLCPDLSDSDWRYCCFLMYGFDTNSEAHLRFYRYCPWIAHTNLLAKYHRATEQEERQVTYTPKFGSEAFHL